MPTAQTPPVTIVSGLPRSGTSLMMQMLQAGGLPVLSDHARRPDADNPRGYLEFEPVKHIRTDRSWLTLAQGKVVKMVHLLLLELPTDRRYQVILMRRDLAEVIRSQSIMLQRSGKPASALNAEQLARIYQTQMDRVLQWLAENPAFAVLEVHYAQLIADPLHQATQINSFLGGGLNPQAMVAAVDPSLYRNRKTS